MSTKRKYHFTLSVLTQELDRTKYNMIKKQKELSMEIVSNYLEQHIAKIYPELREICVSFNEAQKKYFSIKSPDSKTFVFVYPGDYTKQEKDVKNLTTNFKNEFLSWFGHELYISYDKDYENNLKYEIPKDIIENSFGPKKALYEYLTYNDDKENLVRLAFDELVAYHYFRKKIDSDFKVLIKNVKLTRTVNRAMDYLNKIGYKVDLDKLEEAYNKKEANKKEIEKREDEQMNNQFNNERIERLVSFINSTSETSTK